MNFRVVLSVITTGDRRISGIEFDKESLWQKQMEL